MTKEVEQVRQSRAEKLLKKEAGTLRKPTLLVSAITYALLVIVVAYGAKNHVYDGFGAAAPYIVGGIFAFMAVMRASEFLRSVSDYNAVKQFLANRGFIKNAGAELLEDEPAAGQPDYDALDEMERR